MKKLIFKTLLLLVSISTMLISATITITSPSSNISVKDGDEFFTDVMHNPINFDKRRNIWWEENFDESSISVNNGIWSGTSINDQYPGGSIYPLFQGVPGAMNNQNTGLQYPLDSNKYTALSIASSASQHYVRSLYWTHDGNWPDGTKRIEGRNGYWTNTKLAPIPNNQWAIYNYHLAQDNLWTEKDVTGVRFDLANTPIGTQYEYKWARIFDPSTSPTIDISWTTTDAPTSPMPSHVKIFVDTDTDGFNGFLIANIKPSDAAHSQGGSIQQTYYDENTYSFATASLPSGIYYFYLELWDNTEEDTFVTRSAYSSSLTINTKSTIEFTSPSMTSGEDYATKVVEDAWDMNNSEDIVNLLLPDYQKDFIDHNFTDGIFNAKAVKRDGVDHTDVQTWLNIKQTAPIDTSKYRYLSYTMSVDSTYYGNMYDKVNRGWVTRLVWWNEAIDIDGSDTQDNIVYEGTHTYSVDLKTVTLEPDDVFAAQSGWEGNATISNFRIDPLEISNTEGTIFHIEDVKLTANPEPQPNGNFTAQFILSDAENDSINVALYLDTDKTGFDGTSVGLGTFSTETNSLSFSTCNYSVGEYYLYAILTDSVLNVTKRYADVPIKITTECTNGSNAAIIMYLLD